MVCLIFITRNYYHSISLARNLMGIVPNDMLLQLSASSSICFATQKEIASWLFVMMHNAIYFTWVIWLVRQHADTLVWLHSSFTSERVQTLFFDKAAGRVRKIWCLGTRLLACQLQYYINNQWTTLFLKIASYRATCLGTVTCCACRICLQLITIRPDQLPDWRDQ